MKDLLAKEASEGILMTLKDEAFSYSMIEKWADEKKKWRKIVSFSH